MISRFIPKSLPVSPEKLKEFTSVLKSLDKILVMTGAGISTESGIPDYRSKGIGIYSRNKNRPMTIQEFLGSERNRRRYWARNYVAWPYFNSAKCNETHFKLAEWENDDRFLWLITQNVDRLHSEAGSKKVTELHGCSKVVECLGCKDIFDRSTVQEWFMNLNSNWTIDKIGEMRPDGDVEISDSALDSFRIPDCPNCGHGSILKTKVVFFGDNVSRKVVNHCYQMTDECEGLLVLGSSLTVMSGYRFVHQAHLRGVPILIVNIGPTRGDEFATVKLDAKCTEIMKHL
ncbi:hypothetical protein FO519_007273 [Halicephalobus sp. NKZ332]|nr:hypothetical protein FO519_007273 [Halicephalobus sp. NKZ332]